MNDDDFVKTLPPVIRLEVEWGDRRAVAELPPTADIEDIKAVAEWLTGLANDWAVR